MCILPAVFIDEHEYQALVSGAAVQPRPQFGTLCLTDKDRVDFLQRMTTNDIACLQPGQAALTVLTSPVARIDAVFTVLCRRDDLLLLASKGEAENLRQRLQGQIFFMDKVKVTDESAALHRLRLLGPAAGDILAAAGLPQPADDDTFSEEAGVTVLRQERFDLPGFELICQAGELNALTKRLTEAGALPLSDGPAYETRRVELGRPQPGSELTEATNPLEAGLAWVCAENKGCYTGQEVIARQITYDKVTRSLVRLRSELPLTAGDNVSADGRRIGTVTSSGVSPTRGPLALAILKRPHNEEGASVSVEDAPVCVERIPPIGP
ncbi:MAG: hypothetical protein OXF62_19870 [Caldilineaceae bacterium]|nr:hypothetical protein [Caldilineaceae bacterium]